MIGEFHVLIISDQNLDLEIIASHLSPILTRFSDVTATLN